MPVPVPSGSEADEVASQVAAVALAVDTAGGEASAVAVVALAVATPPVGILGVALMQMQDHQPSQTHSRTMPRPELNEATPSMSRMYVCRDTCLIQRSKTDAFLASLVDEQR